MTSWQRIGLVAVLVLAVALGGAALVLRDPSQPAELSGANLAMGVPGTDDGDHMGRVAMPTTGEASDDPPTADEATSKMSLGTLLPADREGPRVIDWDDLMPPEGSGTPVSFTEGTRERTGMPDRQTFGDVSEAEIEEFVRDIDEMRSMQPPDSEIRTDLDGVEVRLAGYATPIGFDETAVTEFLLVPWLGACIHTPPPPANQIVYATEAEGLDFATMWEPIWVTGVLRAVPSATVLADVGYRIEGARVEAYQ